jgi:D-alanyl-D-alanine carboxypeptidase (penicillin-binding protein 5/6)
MRMKRRHLLAGAAVLVAARPAAAAAAGHAAHHAATAPAADPAPPTGTPATTPVGPIDTAARWAVIMDFNTGARLLDKDADALMAPSSMTKIMTAYLVYGALKAGKLRLTDSLPVSERANRMGGSRMFVKAGTSVQVEELIRGMIVQSGNDACIVLAEGIAGSEEAFVELMNAKAREIGLTRTNFRNCTGWPDPDHHSTCNDLARLSQRIILDYPEYYHYDSEKSFKYDNIEQLNRNPLVQKGLADGMKTGHTDEGGYGLVGSADRSGRRVIMVLNGMASMHQRAEESERLLEWSFREFENVTLFTAGDVVERAPVWLGASPSVPMVGGRDLVVTLPRQWRRNAKVTVQYDAPLRAPVARGDAIGSLVIAGTGVPALQMPLLAGADVPKLGLPGRAIAVLSHYFTGG